MSIEVKGKVEIRVVDSRSGVVKQIIKQNNIVPNATYSSLLHWNNAQPVVPGNVFGNQRISISTQTTEPSINNATVNNIIATGYIPSGVTSPTFNDTAQPVFGQIQNRIDYTGTSRSFTTVALTSLSSATQSNLSANAAAYLKLDTVCVQGEYDFLDIFYRVQFLNTDSVGFYHPRTLLDFGYMCFGFFSYSYGGSPVPYSAAFDMGSVWTTLCQMPATSHPYLALYYGEDVGLNRSTNYPSNPNWSAKIINSHYKVKPSKSFGLTDAVGVIFNMMLQGKTRNDTGVYTFSPFQFGSNPFQNLFGHSSTATVPFFDSLKLPSGNGKVILGGNWTSLIPELYKITITTSGATGIATYKWSVRKHLGFNGNTYTDLAVRCPYRNPTMPAAIGMHGWRDENNDVLRYSNTQIIQYDDTGVTLLDLFNGRFSNFDSITTPALTATQIRQCATDGNKIYVGCRATGLWVIDVATNTITHPFTNPCYGVDVGRNGIAFAMMGGGLYRSSDWSTPLSFTIAGITDNNWNKVYFLKVDPEHQDDRLAIVMQPSTTSNRRVVWWSVSTGVALAGYEGSSLKPWASALDVSDTGSFWVAGNVGKLNYGVSTVNTLGVNLATTSLNHSIWGSDQYFKVAFYKNFLIGIDRIVNSNGTVVNSYTSFGSKTFILHLDGGIVLTNREMRQLFTDNQYCWDNYGWNGTNWVLNETGSKSTHTSEQSLANGINVKFQDGSNAPHFTATDYYTQSLNYGLLKDNATTIYYESAWYSKLVKFNYPVQTDLTVPMSSTNPPPTATRYWRLRNLTSSLANGGNWGYREIIFRNEAGADITTGGVPNSSFNSQSVNTIFDKSTASAWGGESYGLNWVQYTFANPVVVYSISINGFILNTGYGMPTDYILEYSLNGGATWLIAYEFKTSITSDNTYYTIPHQYNTAYEVYLDAIHDPSFVTVEADSPELTKLTLNGQPLTTTYCESGILPGPNECVVFGSGRVKFNAADKGKVVSGTYAWVKN